MTPFSANVRRVARSSDRAESREPRQPHLNRPLNSDPSARGDGKGKRNEKEKERRRDGEREREREREGEGERTRARRVVPLKRAFRGRLVPRGHGRPVEWKPRH